MKIHFIDRKKSYYLIFVIYLKNAFIIFRLKMKDSIAVGIIDLQEKRWTQVFDEKNWSWKQYRKEHTLKKSIKWGNKYALSLCLEFIQEKSTLLNLLLLDKSWNRGIRKSIYKNVLIFREKNLTLSQRINLWVTILEPVNNKNKGKNKRI